MNRFSTFSRRVRRAAFGGLMLTVLLAASTMAQAGPPTVYTVGNPSLDPDCEYFNLRDALEAVEYQAGGVAEVRIAYDYDQSLGYNYGGNYSEVALYNLAVDLSIVGGFDNCGDAAPAAGEYTTVTYPIQEDNAQHTMLTLGADLDSPRRYVLLQHIKMQGAADPALTDFPEFFGGGIQIAGHLVLTLLDSSISGFEAREGGGVYIFGNSTADKRPYLVLLKNSYVENNTARNGGGIYSNLGRVVLRGGTVKSNYALWRGGGLYLVDDEAPGGMADRNFALLLGAGAEANYITGNAAGDNAQADNGQGGGVYSKYGQIRSVSDSGALYGFQSYITSNDANYGGGIYIEGPNQGWGGPYTAVRLRDIWFSANQSGGDGGALYLKNAVDADIVGADDDCGFRAIVDFDPLEYEFRPSPCVMFSNNEALGTDGVGEIPRGGAIYLTSTRNDGMSRAIVHVYGALFSGNSDDEGLAAVAAAEGASELVFKRNIFVWNSAKTGASLNVPSALLYSHTGKNVLFQHNTVLASNSSTRMFNIAGGNLDVTGSILWGTVDRSHPFHFVWFASDGATMTHNECLLVNTADDGMAGIPNTGDLGVSGYEPRLDGRFRPRGSSPALDICTSVGNPGVDAYGRGDYDVPGIENGWGIYDLGAVEQTDIIFANHFGYRPTN